MNKFIAGLFAAVLVAGSAFADIGAPMPTAKDLDKVVDQVNYVETAKSGIVLSGYVDVGYIYNFIGSGSYVTGRTVQDGQSSGDFNLNAVKLVLEKPLTDANELQAGFRVDMIYGEDASNLGGSAAVSASNVAHDIQAGTIDGSAEDLLIEQAYVQLRLPYGNGIDIKAGRFVTWLGYEVIERPSNLNITYGNLFVNAIPLHHMGVSGEYKFNDTIDAGFAVVNGYNGSDNVGFDTDDDGYGIMAKLNITNPGGNANIHQSIYYSWNSSGEVVNPVPGAIPVGLPGISTGSGGSVAGENGNVFIYDVWGNWAPKFANDKLLLAFNANYGFAETSNTLLDPAIEGSFDEGNDETCDWWGAALYAKYQFTDVFSLAGRADYIHSNSQFAPVGKFGNTAFNNDLWSLTATAGFDLLENFLVRVEYRYDFGQGATVDAGLDQGVDWDNSAHTIAVQAVYTF